MRVAIKAWLDKLGSRTAVFATMIVLVIVIINMVGSLATLRGENEDLQRRLEEVQRELKREVAKRTAIERQRGELPSTSWAEVSECGGEARNVGKQVNCIQALHARTSTQLEKLRKQLEEGAGTKK